MKTKEPELFCKLIVEVFVRSRFYCSIIPAPGMCYFSYNLPFFVFWDDPALISLVKGLGSARK